MKSDSVKWGIIGAGNVCELKSGPAYQKTKGFELMAVMRRNGEKAKDFAIRYGIEKYYDNADLLINDPEIDAVYIATPPDSHLNYALKVAEANKICCVEKPMAITYKQCLEMERAFAEKNLPLFVAYYRRSLPRFKRIKQWLDDQEIGDVRHINWIYTSPPNPELDLSGKYNWRTDKKIALGGYFDDLASHGLDLFHFYLGEIIEAQGLSINQQGIYPAKDSITGSWIHKTGVTGSGSWNFGSWQSEDRVEIYGSEGKITFSVFANKEIELTNHYGIRKLQIVHPENIQLYHVQDMQTHLSGTKQHPSTAKTATHTAWIMDKILGIE